MGFRFRKSFKIAPGARFTIGKKSSSVSFGGKGFRYTVNSKGRKTTTIGIPGTGISYSSSSSKSKSKTNPPQFRNFSPQGAGPSPAPAGGKPPIYQSKWFIILLLVIIPPVGIFLFLKFWPCKRTIQIPVVAASAIWFFSALIFGPSSDATNTASESSAFPESSVVALAEDSEVEESSLLIEESDISNTPTENSMETVSEPEKSSVVTDSSEAALESSPPVEESVTSTEATESSVPEPDPQIVYWGVSGTKYHIDPECRSFKGEAANSGTIDQAKSAGRTDWCGICSKGWTDERLIEQGNPYAK